MSKSVPDHHSPSVKIGRLESLRKAGEEFEGFHEGYHARDALIRMGETLRAAREAQGLTQAALAEKVGMTQPGISRLESGFGPNGPELETVMRYVHGCDLELVMELRPKIIGRSSNRSTADQSDDAFVVEL